MPVALPFGLLLATNPVSCSGHDCSTLALPALSYLHTGERLILDDYDVEHDGCTLVDPEDLDEAMIVFSRDRF